MQSSSWCEQQEQPILQLLPDMLESNGKQYADVLVVDRIKYLLAVATRPDYLRLTQNPQLMGNSRNGHVEGSRNVANAQLAGNEGRNDADSRRIPEGFEKVAERAQDRFVRHLFAASGYFGFMNA
jgi:hypothetical protein